MAEVATVLKDTPKTVYNTGFIKSLEDDEAEITALEKAQADEVKDAEKGNEEDADAGPTSVEEKTFKKRYGDLRRHQQKQSDEAKEALKSKEDDIKRLQEQLKASPAIPKTEEEIAAFVKEHPDVAAVFETMISRRLQEKSAEIDEKFGEVKERAVKNAEAAAEIELKKAHPDLDELQEDPEFHEWADNLPRVMQKALYEDGEDWRSASRVIDLYKADKAKARKKVTKKPSAAEARKITSKAPEIKTEGDQMLESTVDRMTAEEFEVNEEVIQKAIQEGRFIYDLSGAAR